MSRSLRAAAVFAVPTMIVSACGLYWLRRKRKKTTSDAVSQHYIASTTSSLPEQETFALNSNESSVNRNNSDGRMSPLNITIVQDIQVRCEAASTLNSPPYSPGIVVRSDIPDSHPLETIAIDLLEVLAEDSAVACNKSSNDEILQDISMEQGQLLLSVSGCSLLNQSASDLTCCGEATQEEQQQASCTDNVACDYSSFSITNDADMEREKDEQIVALCEEFSVGDELRFQNMTTNDVLCKPCPSLESSCWSTSCSTPVGYKRDFVGDALSMVSIDSGTGGSNGPSTPPDGNLNPASPLVVHVFDFPTDLCGMLIGRHGRTIDWITRETGAAISVKQKFTRTGLQFVTVEGSQSQVSAAMKIIIRQFPSDRFPGLNFYPVPELSLNEPGPAIELCQMTLPEGGAVKVIVSSVVSPGQVFVQQPTHPSFALLAVLNECMWAFYSCRESLPLPLPVQMNSLCVAPMFGGWFRAQVVEFYTDVGQCLVRFVDYGGYSVIDASMLRAIRTDFTALPFQAVECYLAGVQPPYGSSCFAAEAKSFLEGIVQSAQMFVELLAYNEQGISLINLYQAAGDELVSINEQLVATGFARQDFMPELHPFV